LKFFKIETSLEWNESQHEKWWRLMIKVQWWMIFMVDDEQWKRWDFWSPGLPEGLQLYWHDLLPRFDLKIDKSSNYNATIYMAT